MAADTASASRPGSSSNMQSDYRSTLALHISQDMIPLGVAATGVSDTYLSVPEPVASTSHHKGYGPPPPLSITPLQRLSQQHLHEDSYFDLLCCPLSNANFSARWDRMCVASGLAASTSGRIFPDGYNGKKAQLDEDVREANEDALEAEIWRQAPCFRRSEVNATRSDESQGLIAMAADWLELDGSVEGIRFDSEIALKQEVAYATHLHISTLVLPTPKNPAHISDYARCVADLLAKPGYLQFLIRIPISDTTDSSPLNSAKAMWDCWDTIRTACGYSPRLGVMLDLSTPLPPASTWPTWHSEPVRSIFLPATSFLANKSGYPVLSKALQWFMQSFFRFRPTIILSGIHSGLHSNGGSDVYAAYIRFLEGRTPIQDPLEKFAGNYLDYLQAPLQPLMDNLENDTYEGFERDPIKYRQYEEAVFQALTDRGDARNPTAIFVCGAGRGPLVEGCIRAARRANKPIQLTAVEKNPNAFVILQERKAVEWGDAVELVFSDMRSFSPTHLADIIVSELLGSFGDNELSPECLDGVMRCLKPGGISIPSSYTAYLAPIMCSKLHSEVANATDVKFAEQPYVVMFQSANILSEAGGRENFPKFAECWSFDHPQPDTVTDAAGLPLTNHHNARSAHRTFHIPLGGVCHGFGGYFESILYGEVGISIHPERMDKNMLSWFPLFFPLREPLYLPPRSEVDAHIFRLYDGTKRRIWFEWSAEVYLPLPGHVMAPSPTFPPSPSPNGHANGSATGQRTRVAFMALDARSYSAASSNGPLASPFIGNDSISSAGFMHDMQRSLTSDAVRLKIAQSKLHNPGGRGHWVGL